MLIHVEMFIVGPDNLAENPLNSRCLWQCSNHLQFLNERKNNETAELEQVNSVGYLARLCNVTRWDYKAGFCVIG